MKKCPRCGEYLELIESRNALSRLDNQTYICGNCGIEEALEQFHTGKITNYLKGEKN